MSELVNENTNSPRLSVAKVYTKHIAFETANIMAMSDENIQPEANLDIRIDTAALKDNLHEVILTINVTAKASHSLVYTNRVQQAGIFKLENFNDEQRKTALNVICTSILYPYAAERISNLSTHAGFPSLQLAPINFEALYLKNQKEDEQNSSTKNKEAEILTSH